MSHKWKYVLKFSLVYVLAMNGISVIIDLQERPILEQLSEIGLYLQLIVHFGVGLAIAYYSYRYDQKQKDKLPD